MNNIVLRYYNLGIHQINPKCAFHKWGVCDQR